ncbi:MAG: Nramp family divalent metal transporter [Meiothermus sp.]|uniref:Nramp family divalent metal transporter n=1 Tax=Meiothermus sp. TaxID=1955249 RepID=UPI0025E5D3FB|nr:Nramp family divalent metal transporter [Meiothermus sp.]MCS7195581.1 Nramp family divalent metal transporter [Meiothermus sp.]MDW8091932.1 Nramp family divalent metal transporter [Meiothermus sp.]
MLSGPLSDQTTQAEALKVLEHRSKKRGLARVLPFMGPAFVVSVAYMDPGNFATNIQAGAQFGYQLIWVVVASSLIAIFIQSLSARLGIATGQSLPQVVRQEFRPWVRYFYWVQAELAAMATDLAEFIGAALGFHLLLGLPLFWSAVLAALATFLLLALERFGFRPLEAAITVLVGVIALAYVLELFIAHPDVGLFKGFVPGFAGSESVLLAVGILGATVMPHVIYLHSALTEQRIPLQDPALKRRLLYFSNLDVGVALSIASFVNIAMLVAAAATFHRTGQSEVADITTAYQTLSPLLGPLAAGAFAVALLASGLSSTTVGTMAGQLVMQGFVGFGIPLWLRRLVTLGPSFGVILLGLDPTRVLVLSQVVLSFAIPFALVPLLLFTANRRLMGELVIGRTLMVVGWIVAGVIVWLNLYLLVRSLT